MDLEGTSSTSDKERMENTELAVNILAQGKRNMVCGETPTAVTQFQEACRLLSKAYGETAKECADAYFCYGQALLHLARMETGALGNVIEEDDERSPVEGVGTEDEEDKTEEGEGTEEEGEAVEEADADEESTSQNGSQDGENPDDVSSLQLAWEMLELAKLIYLKDESKAAKLRAAESHLKLGEVSLEIEQYEEAIQDLSKCLEIQREYLEPDNRLLAETYYQLGLAYCFNKQFTESAESFASAIKVIEERIVNQSKILDTATDEEKDTKDFDSPIYKARKEIEELKEILPDIRAKIEDVEDEQKSILDDIKNLAKEAMGATSSQSFMIEVVPASVDVKTTDISHLIKRKSEKTPEDETSKTVKKDESNGEAADSGLTEKRKAEDDAGEESAKKARLELGDGGATDVEFTEKCESKLAAEDSCMKSNVDDGDENTGEKEVAQKHKKPVETMEIQP